MKTWKFVPVKPRARIIPPLRRAKQRFKQNPYIDKEIVEFYKHSPLKISNVKKRSEFNDYDYVHKLDAKTRAWLYSFHREWLCADFKHKGKNLHKSKSDRKKCYDKNNELNRDIYALKRTTHNLDLLGDEIFKLVCDKNYIDGDNNE